MKADAFFHVFSKAHLASIFLILIPAGDAAAATYEVGPGKPRTTIGSVPWESLVAGDTVLIYWRAEPYREKWVICRQGTSGAPITVRGIPGPAGELPVISGENATTRAQLSFWGHDRGVIKIGGANTPPDTMPKHIVLDGLEIRSARSAFSYYHAGSGTATPYKTYAAGIYVEKGENITVQNCAIHDCANGLFVSSGDSVVSRSILVRGNYFHDNGHSGYEHNAYVSAIGVTYEFNRFGPLRAGCGGNNIKDRSAGLVVRYNWIDGGTRQLDLVEGSDSGLVRADPSYRTALVYGNVLMEPPTDDNNQFIHYGGDQGVVANYRKGTLHCYHNTFVSKRTGNTVFVKLTTNEERCDFRNNIGYSEGPVALTVKSGILDISRNWLRTGWKTSFETFTGTLHNDGTTISGRAPGFADLAAQDFRLQETSLCAGSAGPLHPSALPFDTEYVKHQTGRSLPVGEPRSIGAIDELVHVEPSDNLHSGPYGTIVGGVPGAYYTKFDLPCINDAGQLAFAATIKDGAVSDDVLMAGGPPTLFAREGDLAPGAGGATFARFLTPMLDQAGRVAFEARLGGAGVTTATNCGIWSNAFGGTLALVARRGGAAPSVAGATIRSFESAAFEWSPGAAPAVAYQARLAGSGITSVNDLGLWAYDGAQTRLLLRKGGNFTSGGATKTVTGFNVLPSRRVISSQGFGLCAGKIVALLHFGAQPMAVATFHADGTAPIQVAATGDAAPGFSGGETFASFLMPVQNSAGEPAFVASIKGASGTVAQGACYAVDGGALTRVAAAGQAAPGTAGTFKLFSYILNNNAGLAAFMANLTGAGIGTANDTGIWIWDGSSAALLAREGMAAPGCGGATWKTLSGFFLPDNGGPVIAASLLQGSGSPAVTAQNDAGVWVLDGTGNLILLARERTTQVEGKTVKGVKATYNVGASPSQTRSHNATDTLAFHVDFTDGTEGIVRFETD
jgi:hypothetical protein